MKELASTSAAPLCSALAGANDFIEVAVVVCEATKRGLQLDACAVALHRADGGPVVLVDNLPTCADRYRLLTVDRAHYARHPLAAGLRDAGGIRETEIAAAIGELADRHGTTALRGHVLVLPLIDVFGTVGSIHLVKREPYDTTTRRDLETLVSRVSVRLAQLGITAVCKTDSQLTCRQHQIARLVASGQTNTEVAAELGISTNTVKKLLKQIFEKLDIRHRTELVAALPRVAAPLDVPLGITRCRGMTVTRGT